MEDMRTIKQLAGEAMDVQDACNLSGVIHSWGRALARLKTLLPNASTDEINKHPINQLWADKIAHLTGTQYANTIPAYDKVYDLLKEDEQNE